MNFLNLLANYNRTNVRVQVIKDCTKAKRKSPYNLRGRLFVETSESGIRVQTGGFGKNRGCSSFE